MNDGKQGEQAAKLFLEENGLIVEDVTKNPNYWNKDIDFLVTTKNKNQYSIEVKWDERIGATNNLFIEFYADYYKQNKGWFDFCKADLLFYGDAANHLFYVFNFKELKEYVEMYDNWKIKRVEDKNSLKISMGYLVPLSKVQNLILKTIKV